LRRGDREVLYCFGSERRREGLREGKDGSDEMWFE